MSERKARVLITGVAGFIGSNLSLRLLENGHRVTGVDNLSMGRMENLKTQLNDPEFRFVEGDVTDPSLFAGLREDFEVIVHLAAFKIPRYGNAIDTLRINALGTDNMLQYARRLGAKCVVASSSDVYGQNADVPFREESSRSVLGTSKSPRWAYAVSKLFSEHLALAYQEAYDFPVTLLRFFGSYGPHQNLSWWGGPPPVFITAVLSDTEVPIHGDGQQSRSFTFISDVIDALYAAIGTSAADGEIINIGSDDEITILGLARLIKQLSGTPGELKYVLVPYDSFTGKPYEDVMRRVPDNRRCQSLLGVTPRVSLEDGLKRTIEWQKGVLGLG